MGRLALRKIVSGGQTGADMAAWDAAIELGFSYGGWVPKGRTNDDGVIPERYDGIREADQPAPAQRTEWNVRDSDATIVFYHGVAMGGTKWTIEVAAQHGKPCLEVDFSRVSEEEAVWKIIEFLGTQPGVAVLNIAGSKRVDDPLIYAKTHGVVRALLGRIG